MRTYTVSDASQMLNVNEETIRRWIREGKLNGKRAVGRGGNTILLEDIIAFANKPPRAYLLSLESWLKSHDINYKKIPDQNLTQIKEEARALGAGAVATSVATALTGPSGLLIAPAVAAINTSTAMKRKNYQSYCIQLEQSDDMIMTTDHAHKNETEYSIISDKFLDSQPDSKQVESIITAPILEKNINEKDEDLNSSSNISVILDGISRAKQLLDAEIITYEEFQSIKEKLIGKL